MRPRYTLLLTVASTLLLVFVGNLALPSQPTAAQTGSTAAAPAGAPAAQPLPTIVLNTSPVAAAIREQGTALAQLVVAAQTQAASVAQLVVAAQTQASSVAQLLQEAQTQRTAAAQQAATLVAKIDEFGRLANCTVTGTGYVEIKAEPDAATAQIDVKTLAPAFNDALKNNATQVEEAKQQLQTFGIPRGAVQALSPQIAPVLGDDRAITAYRVLTPLQVTVASPNKDPGSIQLAQVLALGGTTFKDVSFSVQKPTQYEEQARMQAFDKATAQAAAYAQMAKSQLGPIISITEDVNSRREPLILAPDKPTGPVFNAQVSVVFALNGPCGLLTPVAK